MLKIVSRYLNLEISIEKLDNMKEIVKKLEMDFDYSRVDLYLINRKIYFWKITFFAESGFGDFESREWDYKFGSYWIK